MGLILIQAFTSGQVCLHSAMQTVHCWGLGCVLWLGFHNRECDCTEVTLKVINELQPPNVLRGSCMLTYSYVEYWFMHPVSYWIPWYWRPINIGSNDRGEKRHAAVNSLLKCFFHAQGPCAILPPILPPSHWQLFAMWVSFSEAHSPLVWVLDELDPISSPVQVPGRVRLKVGARGSPSGSASGHALTVLLHQRDQTLRWATLQQEGVFEQVSGTSPLQGVPGKHTVQEIF